MIFKKLFFITLISSLLFSAEESISLETLEGSWLLRTIDGYQVSKARAILDFNAKRNKIDGYDGCNRIEGKLKLRKDNRYTSNLAIYRYECKNTTKRFVSSRLQSTITEGFSIQKGKMQGEDGILLKSTHHTLFFKKMGSQSILKKLSLPKNLTL
jgi:heat shock protein HslJ